MLLGPSLSSRLILRSSSHYSNLGQKLFSTKVADLANKIPTIINSRQELLSGKLATNSPIPASTSQRNKTEIPLPKARKNVATTEDKFILDNSTGEEAAPEFSANVPLSFYYGRKREAPHFLRYFKMTRIQSPILFICDMQEKFRGAIWEFAKVYVTPLSFSPSFLVSDRLF